MINSKRKGSKFERDIAKWMTKWTGFEFGRTPYSGANHRSRDLSSDIMCNDERHAHRCKISIECKHYKEIKFEHVLLGNKKSDIESFWKQANEDANRSAKVPILIMRYNSMPKSEFFMVVGKELADYILTQIPNDRYMILNRGKEKIYIFMATSILKIKYKDIHKIAKSIIVKK